MIITDVNKQKKHLTEIVIDDCDTLLIDNDICALYSLKPFKELTDDELEKIVFESNYTRAKSRAVWYLDRSDHTEKALFDKLVRAGFEKRACAAVIARMVELGVIDDRRFAENYAERCVENNISKREAIFKMINKGIPRDLAYEAIDALEPDEEAQVRAVIDKKYSNKLRDSDNTQKVYAALVRKGFSFSAVKNVLKAYSEELEYSEE